LHQGLSTRDDSIAEHVSFQAALPTVEMNRQKPKRAIADRGYDSEPLRDPLKQRGIELIAPYRKNNKPRRYENRRKLRRYKRRRIVDRTNSWPGQFRRLLLGYTKALFLKHALVMVAQVL
jgi:transposase